MAPDFVSIHRRALPAVDLLSEVEREAVWQKFRILHTLPRDRWASEGVRRASGDPVIYLVNATPSRVVFFSVPADGAFLLEDFVRQEMLDRYFRKPAESGVLT